MHSDESKAKKKRDKKDNKDNLICMKDTRDRNKNKIKKKNLKARRTRFASNFSGFQFFEPIVCPNPDRQQGCRRTQIQILHREREGERDGVSGRMCMSWASAINLFAINLRPAAMQAIAGRTNQPTNYNRTTATANKQQNTK